MASLPAPSAREREEAPSDGHAGSRFRQETPRVSRTFTRYRKHVRHVDPVPTAVANRLLDISLLGSFRLCRDGLAEALGSGRLQALVGLMALHPDGELPRARVAALLWPESDETQARTNLRKLVARLRKRLAPADAWMRLEGPSLGWRQDAIVTVDTAEFEAAVREGSRSSLERAVEIYRGVLLPDCDDEWVVPERERLRQLYESSLLRLAELLEGVRDYRGAAEQLVRLLREDPLQEETHRQLMRIESLRGDRGAVVRTYETCAATLRRELGVDPSPATSQLLQRLTGEAVAVGGSATLGAALAAREEEQFVGRDKELVALRKWLDAPTPELINVYGPGGTGKSALLRVCARLARRLGYDPLLVDARDMPRTREGFLAALAPAWADGAGAGVHAPRLLLLDTCEELGELSRHLLEDLLARLDAGTKVVLAGRVPVARAWGPDCPWSRVVQPLPLRGFSAQESREYLRRRGLTDPQLAARVRELAGGSPLALSLAADLATRQGGPQFSEWCLVVRSLAEQLLREVGDGRLRELIDAGALVREFDRPMLAQMTGRRDLAEAFEKLCELSFVRPAGRGLTFDADTRLILAQDLGWRDPDRYQRLRLRAARVYRRQMATAPPSCHARLAEACLFLLGHTRTASLMFDGTDDEGIWTEPVRPADHVEVQRIWARWLQTRLGVRLPMTGDWRLGAVLAYPGARLRVARDREGRAVGFSGLLPLCQETLPLLTTDRSVAALLATRWTEAELAAWPRRAADSRAFVLRFLAETGPSAEAVRAALLRDMVSVFASGGAYYVATPIPEYKALVEALGFRAMPGHTVAGERHHPTDAYELDLSRVGFAHWIEGLLLGRQLPRAADLREAERQIQAVLAHWRDDAWLQAASPSCLGAHGHGAPAVRSAAWRALKRARGRSGNDAAITALEAAYLAADPVAPAKAAAQLGVSRATFYRLVRRGVHLVALACVDARRRPERVR